MSKIAGFRIRNYRVLRDVTLGKLWNTQKVWVLEKGEDGFAKIKRASEDPLIKNLVSEGLPLGGLWYSDYLDAR